jgi:leucyl aminopeptidase (aminopeptidase T)
MLKRLNYELLSRGDIARRIPSFYVECLVYGVEDDFFLIERDDRYDRLLRILKRLAEQLADANWCHMATEVNEIKFLFRNNSAWTPTEAAAFVRASINRLTS